MKIDYELMKNICLTNIESFSIFGDVIDTPDGILIYKQNKGAKILGVAHLDTVLSSSHFKIKKSGRRVYNMQLDDRLGVYTMLDLLPQMGIEFDLLLTEGEETGRSTAQWFETDKEYNWIFSFDRHGDDVVLYSYQDWKIGNEWEDSLVKSGFKIGVGSFSDIAFMEDLGIKAVNIGTGYEGEHSKHCYANMDILTKQVGKFRDFYFKNKDIKYIHEKKAYTHYAQPYSQKGWDYGYSRYNPYYGTKLMDCYLCVDGLGINKIVEDIYVCEECMASAQKCESCNDVFFDTELYDGLCIKCARGFDGDYPFK